MGRQKNVSISLVPPPNTYTYLDSVVVSARITLRGAGGGGGGSAVSQGWSLWEGTVHKRSGGGGGGQGGLAVWDYSKASHGSWGLRVDVGAGGSGGNGSWTTNDQLSLAGDGDGGGSTYLSAAIGNFRGPILIAYGGGGGQGGTAKASGGVTDGNGGAGGSGGYDSNYIVASISGGAGGNSHDGCSGGSGGGSGDGRGGNGASACEKEYSGSTGASGGYSCIATYQYWYAYAYVNDPNCSVTVTSNYPYDAASRTATTSSTTVNAVKADVGEGHGATYTVSISDSNHYRFVGWWDGTRYVSTNTTLDITNVSSDVTYRADIERYTFSITYNYNAPAGTTQPTTPGPFEYSNGDGVSTALGSPVRQYCTFLGWYDNAGLTGEPVTSIPDTASGDKTYWAKWSGNTGIIQYQYNRDKAGSAITGDGAAIASVTYNPQTGIVNITLPSPETTGGVYRFYGWYDNPDFTGQRWPAGSAYNGDYVDRVLYARWYTCSVTLSPNLQGGSGAQPQTKNVRPGTNATFTVWSAPVREQYEFQLWAEGSDGTGQQYDPGDTISIAISENIFTYTKTLYAIWEMLYDIIITYRPNGGHWADESEDVVVYRTSNTNPVKSINVFTASGGDPEHDDIEGVDVDFLGWGYSADDRNPHFTHDGTETYTTSGAEDYPPSRILSIELYAVWTGIQTITFVGKIGSNPPSGYPIIDGDVIIAANDIFKGFNVITLETYPDGRLREIPTAVANKMHFNNWWSDGVAGTEVIGDSGVIPDALPTMSGDRFRSDVTLYVHWVPVFYVTFTNIPVIGETVLTTNIDRKLDAFPDLSNLENYIIEGWYDTNNLLVTLDKVYNQDETLHAKYVSCFKITFDPNGGYMELTEPMRTNSTYQLDSYPSAERQGYVMDTQSGNSTGWYYADNPAYPVQTGTIYLRNRTLIAKWIAKDYTITFNANGGEYEGNDDTVQWSDVEFGQPYNKIKNQQATRGDFPVPLVAPPGKYTFIGYSFSCYVPGDENGAPDVTANSDFIDERTTLYAVWRTGNHAITFNPMGGAVVPPVSVTDMDGVIPYYPIPTRTGYAFTGWYLWPVYSSSARIQTQDLQNSVQDAYHNASGKDGNAPKNTVLVNTYDDVMQYRFDGTNWVDITGYVLQTYYYTTDMPEQQDPEHPDEPYVLDSDGQSVVLTKAWQSTREYAGWTLYIGDDVPEVTFGTFDNLTELMMSEDTPRNNDVAKVGSQYFEFKIPFGVTYVLIRSDEHDDAAYTWVKDDTVIVEGFTIGGKWVNSTNDDATVVLPFKIFSDDTEIYAHWTLVPPPSTLSNTCYIERRLSKYGDDTVRLYLPTVTNIEDTITTNLVQKDTLMFGYENKFLSDLGTSRRLAVSVERPNPMPYNDMSNDPSEWSNGKWYKAFLNFTDYWQNFGRDTVTGSMIGGFRFCYTPMASSDEDDRVAYSELFPVLEKNVFLTGNTDISFTDTVLKFTMNLAVGQMTTDANSIGYEIKLTSVIEKDKNGDITLNTPLGIDVQVPDKPIDWTVPEGKMFIGWIGSDGNSYAPGSFVKYTDAKAYRDKGEFFTLKADWMDTEACIMMSRYPNGGERQSHVGSNFSSIVTVPQYNNGKYEMTFLKDAIVEIMMIGGGGGGAGGYTETEEVVPTNDSNPITNFFRTAVNWYAETLSGNVFLEERMSSGGAGGSGKLVNKTITVSAGDKITCSIGMGGGTEYNGDLWSDDGGLYRNGYDGEKTTVTVTYANGVSQPLPYHADGGRGGSRNGIGGSSFMAGGNGCKKGGTPTAGSTSIVAPRGQPGASGWAYESPVEEDMSKTYWCGGAGGGAAPLNHRFKAGSNYLTGGNSGAWFISKGGNGAGLRYRDVNASDGEFGGGGGSGCCGYRYNAGGISKDYGLPIVIHHNNPASGGPGVVFMQITVR